MLLLPLLIVLAIDSKPSSAAEPVHLEMFPRGTVRLLEGPFLEAQRRDTRYLLSLDPDRLLHTFRLNAGLPSSAKPLGGWEAPEVELRGHTLGHYLSACALMFEATGDERLAERARVVTAELARVQQALGRPRIARRLSVGLPRVLLRAVGGPTERLGALLHAPQDPGGPARRASGHGVGGRARAREGHGALAERARFTAERHAVAGAARDRVRRDAGRAPRASPADRGSRAPAPGAALRSPGRLRSARTGRRQPGRSAREHADPQGDRRGARLSADGRAALLRRRRDVLGARGTAPFVRDRGR